MTVSLVGIGTAVPEVRIAQSDAAELVVGFNARTESEGRVLRELYRRSGVKSRHSVILEQDPSSAIPRQSFYLAPTSESDFGPSTATRMQRYADHAGPQGAQAACRAMAASGIASSSVTHLVTVSCTGFCAPGLDIEIMHALELRPSTSRTHLGFMGCHGAMNGLRVADAYLRADSAACVLLVCSELCSLHHQYGWSPDRIVSNALFADGAAAVVLRRDVSARAMYRGSGSFVVPGTLGEMTWKIGNNGFAMTLSARVPELIQQHLKNWMTEWLARFDLSISDIRGWAIHPGGPRILTAAAEALSLDRSLWQTSADILGEYGNMSSPTVLFILDRMLAVQAHGPVVMLAFGPGLTIEAALLDATA